ncbi:hypothetical protein C8F04DRAFT_1048986 [Mycena alexandri]|uniref:Uncharacterized protein n=1 Tax=Mycena alexandri TaxID=1745969 RepID=A0AAD6S773_9AGAR|nr:hypothetical protein C8F04DRAFT_1048986 [Mycena alexandri]
MKPDTTPLKSGLVNFPGATPESTALVAELLHTNFTAYHCFHNDQQFSNHLSHHILTLHDLGASAECIREMFAQEAAKQRDLFPNGTPTDEASDINESNWIKSLGKENSHKYPHYLSFFLTEIKKDGVSGVLERYLFSPEANANGTLMLTRFVGRLFHPMIDAGFGVEFGQDFIVAQGLAQAALTEPDGVSILDDGAGLPKIQSGSPTTLLSLLREVYESPKLAPMPYETESSRRSDSSNGWSRTPSAERRSARSTQSGRAEEDIMKKVEECMWQATLLLGATSKPGRKPRMDFFFMHLLTSSLFLRGIVDAIQAPIHKAQLLQAYARTAALYIILRGRPRIDPALVMSYPASPAAILAPTAILGTVGYGSPWLPLLNNAAMHTEPHVVKAIRMLFYCAQQYGGTPAEAVIGAVDGEGKEIHKGAAKLDGTLFIRVAGKLTDAVGWVANGEKERFWDFGGIGWEEAWARADE